MCLYIGALMVEVSEAQSVVGLLRCLARCRPMTNERLREACNNLCRARHGSG